MLIIVKIILLITFFTIVYQDIKDRLTYWFLYPIVALCCGTLMFKSMGLKVFIATITFNIAVVSLILLVIFLYTRLIKKMIFKAVIGLGDVLLFYALCFSFAMVSFYVLFIFSFVFAFVLQLLLKKNFKDKTVPLAGFMSLFFGLVYLAHWAGVINSVYQI